MAWILVDQREWEYVTDSIGWIVKALQAIDARTRSIQQMEVTEMADLTQLTADVAANNDAVQSAITLLNGLKAALDAAGTDPAALKDLSDKIEASTAALSAAVVANTPAAPPSP